MPSDGFCEGSAVLLCQKQCFRYYALTEGMWNSERGGIAYSPSKQDRIAASIEYASPRSLGDNEIARPSSSPLSLPL